MVVFQRKYSEIRRRTPEGVDDVAATAVAPRLQAPRRTILKEVNPRAGRGQGVVSTPEGAPGAAWSQSPLHVPIAAPPSHPNKAARTGRKRELHNCNPMGPQNKTTRRPSPGRGSGPGSAHSLGFPPTHTRADLTSPETCTPTLAMAVRSHSPVTTGRRVGAAQPWRPAAQRPGCLPARPVLCPAPRGMLGRAWPVESRRSRL